MKEKYQLRKLKANETKSKIHRRVKMTAKKNGERINMLK